LSETGQVTSNADRKCLQIICSLCQEPVKENLCCNGCQRKLVIEVIKKYGWAINDDTESKIHLLPTDKHPADDWAIIAAMGLLKLGWNQSMLSGGDKEAHNFWLQAAVLLEFAHSKSKANPQILLLLIRLYTVLGAGSLALRAYKKLGLKQIQTETLGYLMSDRISSMHPHPVEDYDSNSDMDVLDPCERLENIQKMSRNFKNQIATNSWKAFECGSYDTVFQLLEVSNRLSQSLNIASAVIELRRIKRITDPKAVMDSNNYGYDLLRKLK
jgi:N-terminal acetyltransferase B complex non-catalytic subunit